MDLYRVCNVKYKDKVLSGIGAEKVGGRWNEVGTRAVYCSENVSLALLEYYAHSENRAALPKNILVAKITFPNTFKVTELKKLPAGWNNIPYSSESSKIFTELASSNDFFALRVPSIIVGVEFNYILNPLYKEFGKVEVLDFLELPLDDRLKTT